MKRYLPLLAALILGAHPAFAFSEAEAMAGRSIVNRYADAIVAVHVVITMNISVGERTLPPQEAPLNVNATVISPSGLTVTALSALDPSSEIGRIRARLGAAARNPRLGEVQFKEVKIILADGTEIPGRVVLKDSSTDLAFVAPLGALPAGRTLSYVHLENATVPQLLENCFDLGRTPREMHRLVVISPCTIDGIYNGPRPIYVVSSEHVGCPVFNEPGSVLGVCVRFIHEGRALSNVVLPAARIAEVAVQAAAEAAKPPPEPAPSSDDDSDTGGDASPPPAASAPAPGGH